MPFGKPRIFALDFKNDNQNDQYVPETNPT